MTRSASTTGRSKNAAGNRWVDYNHSQTQTQGGYNVA